MSTAPEPNLNPNDTAGDLLPHPAGGLNGERWLDRFPFLRRSTLRLLDALIIAAAFWISYYLSFLDLNFTAAYQAQREYLLLYVVIVQLLLLQVWGAYRGITRYTGLHEVISLNLACICGTLALIFFNLLTSRIFRLPDFPLNYPIHRSGDYVLRLPWRVIVQYFFLANFGVTAVRLARRVVGERLLSARVSKARRVLIVGAGDAGEQVVRDMHRHPERRYNPVAFVDPDRQFINRRIHGVPVLGTLEQVPELLTRKKIQMVVVALPRPAPRMLQSLVDQCQQARIAFKIIPDLNRVLEGGVQISQLRNVEIEDLLGRPPVTVPTSDEHSCVRGKRVLVTGAGGSIGSELCRQALAHGCASLTLLGRGENSLYEIHHELAVIAGRLGIPLELVVGNIVDAQAMRALFARTRPQVVLHAAAHKHVHFMEAFPAEAIKNNVLGTRTVAQAALAVETEKFILISTDKAVRPTGVMGASKRVAEMVVSSLNGRGATGFIAVRFGNVLGSRGSVIPLFRRQIAAGGPITVTHPDVTRYFMTIPEAVSLVLEAGSVGQGGEVFLLDMGQPVKIVDLARRLITLSGLEPGADIQIEFSGLRPGEKLYEELLTEGQARDATGHEKIFRSLQPVRPWAELWPEIEALEAAALRGEEDAIRASLHTLIADYLGAGTAASGK